MIKSYSAWLNVWVIVTFPASSYVYVYIRYMNKYLSKYDHWLISRDHFMYCLATIKTRQDSQISNKISSFCFLSTFKGDLLPHTATTWKTFSCNLSPGPLKLVKSWAEGGHYGVISLRTLSKSDSEDRGFVSQCVSCYLLSLSALTDGWLGLRTTKVYILVEVQ